MFEKILRTGNRVHFIIGGKCFEIEFSSLIRKKAYRYSFSHQSPNFSTLKSPKKNQRKQFRRAV
jgi:hypothetical protein